MRRTTAGRQVTKRSSSRSSYFRIYWTAGVEIGCPGSDVAYLLCSSRWPGQGERGCCGRCVPGWSEGNAGIEPLAPRVTPGRMCWDRRVEPHHIDRIAAENRAGVGHCHTHFIMIVI